MKRIKLQNESSIFSSFCEGHGLVHGRVCWACVTHTAHTRACTLGVCILQFSFLLLYTGHTRACVGRVSHTRSIHVRVWLGVCLSFPSVLCTRSIHGRVCWACVFVFSPYLIHGLSTRACVPAVCFPSFPKLTFYFPLTSICFVFGFLPSNCVQIFYKPTWSTSQTQDRLAWESLTTRDILDASSKANHDLGHGCD